MDLQQNVTTSFQSFCLTFSHFDLFFFLFQTKKIDDFLSLGCYKAPSTFSFNAMTQANAIAKTDSMSWSLCARNCQFQSKLKKNIRFLK